MMSELRRKKRGVGWWVCCLFASLSLVMLVGFVVVPWLGFGKTPRLTEGLSASCNVVTWLLLWVRCSGRRRMGFGASPTQVWISGRGLRRYFDWGELAQISYSPATSHSVRIVLRPRGRRAGAAAWVARPVAEQFLAEADGRGIAIRSADAPVFD